ncbi:AAA family ATPase [Streptomyces sp. NBC_01264]|uniref:AAA family ATPase n=1 Tax=Streptomyces sp. NBC_01264 TaxID=2903804 RepID=UPI00224E59C9|nr:adenylate/guanylate cyclase domain-containing protein [Streptomyces sp. NBC_01264]MCX4782617.1 AAA family ATPase [Streptomyces sp. NBC_01264]
MSRRLVVVLFLDLVGWTRLAERVDPESLQGLLDEYYEICSVAVEEQGGVVEKFIGDAVMAVFGADTSQEDDAPRALRAATRIRAEVRDLRTPATDAAAVEVHCGIAAGEALVTRSARAGIRVVGDVVNLAARLQSLAVAGEIIVNETVAHLARPHYTMVPVPPVTLKGKSEPVPVLVVTGEAAADGAGENSLMVDRSAERHRLRRIYHRVARERRAELVTVLGPPGIGKTRLVREAVDDLVAAGARPVAVFGSCQSYGTAGNHGALVEMLDALIRRAPSCAELLRADERIAAVLAALREASLPRRAGAVPGPGVEEVSWATRELLTTAAGSPLVVVWDNLAWAGQSLLRLIGELMDGLRDLPLLMVCVSRPELAEREGPWSQEADLIEVGALVPADSARLAVSLAGSGSGDEVELHGLDLAEHVDRVALYSAGNPLYIRLMMDWLRNGRTVDEVPPSITAMVGAMIDRLPAPGRRLLGAASVIGPSFTLEQLALLGEPAPEAAVAELAGRRLFRATEEAGGYRFVQQPVHEVAYGRLEKEQRVSWHRRLAEHGFSPGFHLEAATRLLGGLRPDDAELPELARQAAGALLGEGTVALRQRDVPTAIGLLGRALVLARGGPDRCRSVAAVRLSDALMLSGDTRGALEVVEGGWRDTGPGGGPGTGTAPALVRVQRLLLAARLGKVTAADLEGLRAALGGAEPDRSAPCRFEQLRMLIHLDHGRFGAAEEAACAALAHARDSADAYEEDRLLVALCEIRQWSPSPIAQKLAGCAELLERFAADRFLALPALAARARCLALTGDRSGARSALTEAESVVVQLRLTMGRVLVDQVAALAASLDGEHAEAERRYRRAADALEEAGYVPVALTMRVQAARECARRGRADEAARRIAELLARREEMDVRGRILCLSAAVLGAAAQGRAEPVRAEVLRLLRDLDDPCLRGEVCFDLARAHRLLGEGTEALAMAGRAAESYAAVGAVKPLEAVRAWM